jgi:hypothetical protein
VWEERGGVRAEMTSVCACVCACGGRVVVVHAVGDD